SQAGRPRWAATSSSPASNPRLDLQNALRMQVLVSLHCDAFPTPRWADGNRLILLARSRRPVRPRSNAEAAFANAGTTRVQLSDLSARRMFTSYVRTQTRTSSVAVEVDTSEEGFSMNDARDEAINVSTFASQSAAAEAAPLPAVVPGRAAQKPMRPKNWRRQPEKGRHLMAAAQGGESRAYETLLRELDAGLRRYYARRLPAAAA